MYGIVSPEPRKSKTINFRNLYGLALIVGIVSALLISTAAHFEGPPRNSLQTVTNLSDMEIFIDRVSPLKIPVRDYFEREKTNLTVNIFPTSNETIRIESVKLNLPAESDNDEESSGGTE
jgi:hypothetical protein